MHIKSQRWGDQKKKKTEEKKKKKIYQFKLQKGA